MEKYSYYINGEIADSDKASIRIDDLGLLRGYGIFDFFRAIEGRPVFIEDHLDRLENSARLMDIKINKSRQELKNDILNIINLNNHKILGVKLVITGGYSPDGYEQALGPNIIIIAKPFTFSGPETGLKVFLAEHQREMAEIKTTNYIFPIRHLKAQRDKNAQDILYHHNGFISELSRSNIFIIKKEKIITPKAGILYGVTRKHLINIAKESFEVEERNVTMDELMDADEIFTTSSSKRIVPITNIDSKIFSDGERGKITAKLYDMFLKFENEFY